jgi:hypothetical protein
VIAGLIALVLILGWASTRSTPEHNLTAAIAATTTVETTPSSTTTTSTTAAARPTTTPTTRAPTATPSPTGISNGFSTNTEHPPAADVVVSGCAFDRARQMATAYLTITNHSSKRSHYEVAAVFNDPNHVQVGSGYGFATNIDPGQIAKTDAAGFPSGDPPSVACVIKEVNRFSAVG